MHLIFNLAAPLLGAPRYHKGNFRRTITGSRRIVSGVEE